MWKPGSQKPGGSSSKKKKNKGGKSPSSSSIGGLQIPEASPLQHTTTSSNGQSPSQNETTTPDSRKKLSGSTMNMRFMQRHSQQQNHSSRSPPSRSRQERSQSPKSHPSNPPHSLQQQQLNSPAGADIAVPTPTNSSNDHDHERIIMADDDENDDDGASDVDMKDASPSSSNSSRYGVATSADMYGYSHVSVIGRRSFGGCNPTMAEAWQLSQQAERDDAQQQSVSDKELVKRYLQSRKSADRQKAVGARHEQYKGKNKRLPCHDDGETFKETFLPTCSTMGDMVLFAKNHRLRILSDMKSFPTCLATKIASTSMCQKDEE